VTLEGAIMTNPGLEGIYSQELFGILEETFDVHHGVYLDRGTSLLPTLDQISADQASVPVGGRCATIAAQVEHVIYYLQILERDIAGQEVGPVDWNDIWDRVSGVTAAEWDDLRTRLRVAYDQLRATLQAVDDWARDDAVGASMAILVHTAYHLGEIRQALCTLGRSET
jgi:hypothetical protein